MDNFDLKKFLVENRLTANSRLEEEEVVAVDPVAEKDAQQGLKGALVLLQQGVNSIQVSPKDGELDESMTLGLIVGAPGLISLLGKGVNGISSLFQRDKKSGTVVGNALKKFGHTLEEAYIGTIGTILQKAFPKTYAEQDVHDSTSTLHDAAHGVYAAMLVACAVSSGMEAMEAHTVISKGLEYGLSGFKSSEVVGLANKIAAA